MVELQEIQNKIAHFADVRDWKKYHSPKNLSMSIAIEAAELMEHFQWISSDESIKRMSNNSEMRTQVEEELADILIYIFAFSNMTNIDIKKIIYEKLKKNETRFPEDKEYNY